MGSACICNANKFFSNHIMFYSITYSYIDKTPISTIVPLPIDATSSVLNTHPIIKLMIINTTLNCVIRPIIIPKPGAISTSNEEIRKNICRYFNRPQPSLHSPHLPYPTNIHFHRFPSHPQDSPNPHQCGKTIA